MKRIILLVAVVAALGMAGIPAAQASQYVRTESGRVRCIVGPDRVACEASGPGSTGFPQAPISMPESQCRYSPCPGGIHFDLAEVTSSGFQLERRQHWWRRNATERHGLELRPDVSDSGMDGIAEQRRHSIHQRCHRSRNVCQHRKRRAVLIGGQRMSAEVFVAQPGLAGR